MRRLIASAVLASFALAAAAAVGCGEDRKMSPRASADRYASEKKDGGSSRERADARAPEAPAGNAKEADGARGQDKPADAEKPQRKIVYTGNVSLVVEDFDKAETLLTALVQEHGGYVSRSEVRGEPGQPRNGSWTIRVPVAKGEEFRKEILKIGELRNSSLDSRDVTDEYYDTKAVIKNLEAREEALRGLYKEKLANSRLQELIEVDRELNSVRTQINVRKGQIQRWDKETELTTFTITIFDRRGYVPPASPDFGSTVGRTWSGSLDALASFGKAIVLFLVAITPWLPVIVVVAGVPVWLLRRAIKSAATPRRPVPTAEVIEDVGERRE